VLSAHDRVKSGVNRRASVRWRNTEPPTFVVEPGGELTLLLTSPDRRRAGITAHLVGPDGRSQTPVTDWIDIEDLARPVAVELDAAGWRRVADPGAPPATGFMMWWEGGLPEAAVAEVDADAAALDQLRALGYVQ
jgi:hypothetical protein